MTRLDHIPVYLLSLNLPTNKDPSAVFIANRLGLKIEDPPNPHLAAALLMTHLHTPANRVFRRNMWYLTKAVQMVVLAPFLLVFVFGCIAVKSVSPSTVGLGIVFALTGILLMFYAGALWVTNGWRMMRSVAWMFAGAFILLVFYNVLVVFKDPAPFSLFSATAAFLTMNMLGMIWIAFMNDPQIKKSFKQVTASLTKNHKIDVVRSKFRALGTMGLKFAAAATEKKADATVGADNFWGACSWGARVALGVGMRARLRSSFPCTCTHARVRELVCVCVFVRVLVCVCSPPGAAGDEDAMARAKAVTSQPWLKGVPSSGVAGKDAPAHPFADLVGDAYTVNPKCANGMFKFSDGASSVITGDLSTMSRRLKLCYGYCVAMLCILAFVSWDNEPNYKNQGLAVMLSVLVLDSCMYLLWRGGLDWSPSYSCLVMGLSRAAIAAFVGACQELACR